MIHDTSDESEGSDSKNSLSTDMEEDTPELSSNSEDYEQLQSGGYSFIKSGSTFPGYYKSFSRIYPDYETIMGKTLPNKHFLFAENIVAYIASLVIRDNHVKDLLLFLPGIRFIRSTQERFLFMESKRDLVKKTNNILQFSGDITVQFDKTNGLNQGRNMKPNTTTTIIIFEFEPTGRCYGLSKDRLEFLLEAKRSGIDFTCIGVDSRKNGADGPYSGKSTLTTWTFAEYEETESTFSHLVGMKNFVERRGLNVFPMTAE